MMNAIPDIILHVNIFADPILVYANIFVINVFVIYHWVLLNYVMYNDRNAQLKKCSPLLSC